MCVVVARDIRVTQHPLNKDGEGNLVHIIMSQRSKWISLGEHLAEGLIVSEDGNLFIFVFMITIIC